MPDHIDLPGGPAPRTVPQDPESVEDERAVRAEVQRRINAAKRMEESERDVVLLEVERRRRAEQEREILEALLQTD